MLWDSVVVVVVVVVRTHPQAIPLAMITMRKSTHGLPFVSHYEYGAPLGGPLGCQSSAIKSAYKASTVCQAGAYLDFCSIFLPPLPLPEWDDMYSSLLQGYPLALNLLLPLGVERGTVLTQWA